MSPKLNSSWLGYAATGVLAVLLLFGLYYFVYVERHSDQIEDYALHKLQASGEYIQDALERLALNVENALKDSRAA